MPHEKSTPLWPQRLAVVVVALVASLSGLWNDFAHDDVSLILDNTRAHDLGSWWTVFTSPYWPPPFPPELYRPIASLLLSLEYAFGAGAPIVFRVASYGLYAASALVVFSLASRLLSRRGAFAVALLFAAHPVHVEAVALGVNQAEVLVGLLAALAVARYVDARRLGPLSPMQWATLVALYAIAALTKETGFVLPVLLVAAEVMLVSDDAPLRARLSRTWPGFAALAATGTTLLLVRRAVLGGNMVGTFTAEALVGSDAAGRLLTMLQVVPKWFRLLVWPAHLQIDYSPNEIVRSIGFGPREALGAALLFATVAVGWWAWRRARVVTFGLVWCAVALLPVANVIVPTSIVLAERTLFVPSIGFLLAVGAAAEWLLESSRLPSAYVRRGLVTACGIFVLLGVGRSIERHTVWRNNAHLWLVAGRDAPLSYRVARAQGDAFFALGDIKSAIREYDFAINASPKPWRLRYDLALRLREAGRDTAALSQLQMSVFQDKDQQDARAELALTLIAVGAYKEAKATLAPHIEKADTVPLFRQIESLADSALAAGAPAGSVRVRAHVVVDDD